MWKLWSQGGELDFENLWGHGCHKARESTTSTLWAVQGCKSQDGPRQRKTVLCPLYIIKITYILHSFQITKLSRNPTTKMLCLLQNLIRNWSPFQKIMSPNAVLDCQYRRAVSVHVCSHCLRNESTYKHQAMLH